MKLNYINMNSGNFYRAISLELDEHFKKDFFLVLI